MSVQLSTTSTGAVVLILILIPLYLASKKGRLPLPPGPKGWPLIGNLFDIPKANFSETYGEWARKYGKIVYADVAGQPLIILNDVKVANEILDKQGSTCSDRPVLIMAGELAGFGGWTSMICGPRLTESRKYMHRTIGSREALEKFDSVFDSESRKFLKAALRDPDNIQQHIRRSTGTITLRITYGYGAEEGEDLLITLVESTLLRFTQYSEPGAYLVDFIPLSWFPGADFKKEASKTKRDLKDLADIPFQFTLDEMAKGQAPPSLVANNLGDIMTEVGKENMKWSASSLFAGGADTTVSAVYTFYLAMTLFPDIQRKAQDEIDRVIGNERLPELGDRDSLPYIDALHSEIYRWRPIGPIGIPHRSTTTHTLRGYHIPKGSIIITNIHHMLHDPAVYSDPELFNPERFLGTRDKPAEQNPRACVFGFGRRICPGIQFADTTVWLAIARSLAVFRVSKVVEGGVEATPEGMYTDSVIRHPEKFKCIIKPRSAQAEALILQS